MTEKEKISFVKDHYLKLAKSDEEKSIIEKNANLPYDEFISFLNEHEITQCPPERPILCMDGSCVAVGEPCPME